MKRIILLLLFVLISYNLSAQQAFTIAVLTQNTHYRTQNWLIDFSFPLNKINDNRKEGYFITNLQYNGNVWSVILSKTSVIKEQVIEISEQFPEKFISDNIGKGFDLTAVCYNDTSWHVIMSVANDYKEQKYYYGKEYPTNLISDILLAGFNINSLQFSDGYWIMLYSKNSGLTQEIVTFNTFNDENLNYFLASGYVISDITYKDKFYSVMTKGLNWSRQESYLIDYTQLSNATKRWWEKKFTFTNFLVIIGDTLEPSQTNNYKFLQKFNFMSSEPKSQTDSNYVDFIKQNPNTEAGFRALQKITGLLIKSKNWSEASKLYSEYLSKFPSFSERFNKIMDVLDAKEEGVKLHNLGTGVNSNFDEYFPIINLEGNKLYFCSFNRPDGFGGEDIYISKLENGVWTKAENAGRSINTLTHEAALGVSADDLTLTVFGNYNQSFGNGDIFYFTRSKEGWSTREHYEMPINSYYFDSDVSFSSDGKAFFFASDRPLGGKFAEKDNLANGFWGGDLNIYVMEKTGSGWTEPVSLGDVINTPFVDRSPYLHADGKTLYFSSSGHPGLGGLDVFKSVRLNPNSWTEWSEPVNLGKEINTAESDWGYKVSLDGNYAYFAAINPDNVKSGQDVFNITLPQKARPEIVATIKGKVLDPEGNPLEAKIKWEDLTTGISVGELNSDPDDGSFFIALPLGKKYGYFADKKDYYPVSKNLDLTAKSDTVKTYYENVVLVPIKQMKEQNVAVRVNNLFFGYNKAELLSESFSELNRLADILKNNPDFKIEITGHTDDVGSASYNKTLSLDRAKAVAGFLKDKGIDSKALITKGLGKTKPLAPNDTEEGKAQNRRVEIRLIGK